ncbi:hypothetical protein chiPu_0003935 [Chiloscyllium punctatum]|uniref:Uncharacterized protein n=1 Tax=Chiloscyllium punctatum TaxID=137246 RepID=A0A401S553_CHIPU|nr:hypothetical protein [Chiloscyllium punctatum]
MGSWSLSLEQPGLFFQKNPNFNGFKLPQREAAARPANRACPSAGYHGEGAVSAPAPANREGPSFCRYGDGVVPGT